MRFSDNVKSAFATALLCAIWIGVAPFAGLTGWAGFGGCTAYFACPARHRLRLALICVTSGIFYALCAIWLGRLVPSLAFAVLMTFIITFLMCAGPRFKALAFVPGAFIGSFSSFAANGDMMVAPSLLVGVFLGLACDKFGQLLCRKA